MRGIFVTTLFFLVSPSILSAAELRVGIAEVDVTPKLGAKPVYIAGYGKDRKATGILDPIMARAIVFHDGSTKFAIVAVDVVGLFFDVAERVRKALPGFDYIVIHATHNHEGPDTLGLWGKSPFHSGVDPEYMQNLEAKLIAVIRSADEQLRSVSVRIAVKKCPEILHDSREPYVLHDDLVVLEFLDAAKKPTGILVQWNSHPEALGSRNTKLSADFVASTVATIRKEFGCPVVYVTGTVGGLMGPIDVPLVDAAGNKLPDNSEGKTIAYGTAVGKAAIAALRESKPVSLTPIVVRTQKLLIPVQNKVYQMGWSFGVLRRDMFLWEGESIVAAPKPNKDVAKPAALLTEIGYVRIGDVETAVIPGEIYPELVLGKVQDPADKGADFPDAPIEPSIYDGLTAPYKMMIGLGNDEIGYIIPKRQWDELPPYCYGRKKSQYGEINSVGPEAAPIICTAFRKLARAQ